MIVFLVISAAVVIVGALLPWVSGTVSTFAGPIYYTYNGFDDTMGIISIVLGAVNGGLGLWAGRRTNSARIAAIGTIILGIAVVGIAVNAFINMGGGNFSFAEGLFTGSASPEPGLFVTAIGGIMICIGGIVAAIRERD